jgi:hypothetical protein
MTMNTNTALAVAQAEARHAQERAHAARETSDRASAKAREMVDRAIADAVSARVLPGGQTNSGELRECPHQQSAFLNSVNFTGEG